MPRRDFSGIVEIQDAVWDDLRVPVTSIVLGGAQPPTATSYKSGHVLAFATNQDNTIYFQVQLPHGYKEGSDIIPHIHWTLPTSGSGGGAENVKWDLTYSDCQPSAGSFGAATTESVTIDVQNDAADDHLVDTITTIDGTAFKLSRMFICSLTRDVSVSNDYADDAYLISIDFHFLNNTIGSQDPFDKF